MDIPTLHKLYCQLTGLILRLDMDRERMWFEWCRRGFTADDLCAVIAHIRQGIKTGKRNPGALKFSNLIGNLDYFEEDLALIRATRRTPRPELGRAAVLRATGRPPAAAPPPAKKVDEILASPAFKKFCELKKTLSSTEGKS